MSTPQRDPAVLIARHRQARQRPAQPSDLDPAAAKPVVEGTMPTPMFGGQRQPDQRADRPLSAQHGLSQLKQRIRPQSQAVIERTAKRIKIV
jgi:hypothetical protein